MAIASSSIHHHTAAAAWLPLSHHATITTTTTTTTTTITDPPARRANSAVKIPSSISALFQLHISHHADIDTVAKTAADDYHNHLPTTSPKEDISSLRSMIHGPDDWSPLLSPLHPWLRREIVKYGELAQATYDAFDANPFSPFCGSCLYNRHHLLKKLGLAGHGYGITKYLYATSHLELPRWLERSIHSDAWSNESNWMGFVAVSDDAESRRIGCRNIAVAWRGTMVPSEWLEDLQGRLEPLGPGHGEARVEHGFLSMYTSKSEASIYNKESASVQMMEEVRRLVGMFRDRGEEVSLTVTGHSLGGALAMLSGYEAASGIADLPVSVITFGAPRVGNEAFAERVRSAGVKALRAVVKQDVVPKVPGILFNEGLRRVTGSLEWAYTHVGVELALDVRASPYLKKGGMDFAGFHGLETYLHLVDGYRGGGGGFRADAKRDAALVNKASGLLRAELGVPECWNQAANKGLICNGYGRWVRPVRDPEDIPSPFRDAVATEVAPSFS